MARHNYKKDIIDILAKNGGCVESFNDLLRLGSFNPNYLRKYLIKLKSERRITSTKIANREQICLEKFDFDEEFMKFTKDMNKIETKLARKDLNEVQIESLMQNYLFLALKKYHNLNIALLYSECVTNNKTQQETIVRTQERLFHLMKMMLKKMSENSRIRIINYLVNARMMF